MLERIKYIVAVVLYGTIGMFLRQVTVPSEIVAMMRGLIGSVFILIFLRMGGKKLDTAAIRRNRFHLVLSGMLLGLNWIFLFAAYTHTTVAIASLCNYMAPIIVLLVAPFVLKEPLNKKKLPLVGVAFLGIILVSGVIGGEAGEPKGILMGLMAAFAFVGIVLSNRKMRGINAYERAVVQLAISALTILPYVLVKNAGSAIDWNLRSVLIIGMLGLVHTGFAYCLYFSGMSRLPVPTVAILGYLEPVVSVFCSAVFLQEDMGPVGWIGAVLIIGAAALSEMDFE